MTDVHHSGRSSGFLRVVKRELLELLPTTVFFLIGFNLIAFTVQVALAEDGIAFHGVTNATIGALLVAKVVLLVDKVPLIGRVKGRPLIWPVLYRSVVYTFFVFVGQAIEGIISGWIDLGSLPLAVSDLVARFDWGHFLVVHLWVLVLFLVYITGQEIRRSYGTPPLWKALTERDPG